jgi:hypothetical protein
MNATHLPTMQPEKLSYNSKTEVAQPQAVAGYKGLHGNFRIDAELQSKYVVD